MTTSLDNMRFDDFVRATAGSPGVVELTRYLDATGKFMRGSSVARFDAAIDTSLIARALIYVKKQMYQYHYPALKARQLIPVATDTPAGAESISTFITNGVGQARIVANHADDLPRVDVFGSEDLSPVRTLGDSYAYSVIDLARAAVSGVQLDTMRAMWAKRGMEQSLEDIAALGDADSGLPGLLNNPNVAIDAATGNWSGLTAAQILADLARLCSNMITTTNGAEQPDTLLLPTANYAQIAQTPYSSLNGQTVLAVFRGNNPYMPNIDTWIKLDTAGAAGVKRIVAYRRAPDVLTLEIPQEFTQMPPEPRNLDFVVNCWSRIGGVKVRYPGAIRFMDGS